MAIVMGCLGHAVKLVFPVRIVTFSVRGNSSDVLGLASIGSGGGSIGTAKAILRRSQIGWPHTKDEDRMLLLPAKVTSLATFGKAV